VADYDFRGLSPIDFEALVRDLLQASTGRAFATFAVGPDGGIDCRHVSTEQTIIAQCKHRPDAKRAALVSAAAVERDRFADAASDSEQRPLTSYYFVTSADLSPDGVGEVTDTLGALVPHSGHVWTRGQLNALLTEHPEVERRHFKLWLNSAQVFDRIVGSGEWERNESLVRGIKDHVELWVHTPKYTEALETLHQSGVVIISGAPGVGKSTMAEMLLLTHWEAGFKVVKITSDVADAWRHVRQDSDEKVILYYDDFLGQTSSAELQKNEGSDLGQLIRALRRSKSKHVLLVMTTREQILNAALQGGDDRIARALDGHERVRVELATVTRIERARMLVNHLYFSYRGTGMLSELADDIRYRSVIDHPGFNPRVLESVVVLKSPPTVDLLYSELLNALNHPDEIWAGSFSQLSSLASRLVLHLAIEPGREVPVTALEALVTAHDDAREFHPALKTLEDTWIRIDTSSPPRIRLYDPSRRDFLLDRLGSGPIFNEVLRDSTSLEQLEFLLQQESIPLIRPHVVATAAKIEEHAVTLLHDALLAAGAAEAARAKQPRSGFQVPESYDERMEALSAAVGVFTRVGAGGPLEDALESSLVFLNGKFDRLSSPAASAAFALASALNDLEQGWAQEFADAAVTAGVYAIDRTTDLREYADLDYELRYRTGSPEVASTLEGAFNELVDGVTSGSEPSSMLLELDDLDYLASELNVSIQTDYQRDYVSGLHEDHAPGHYEAVRPLSYAAAGSNSDDAIASFFGSLRTDDD